MSKNGGRLIALTSACLMSTACAFAPQLHQVAVDHDQMIAVTEDELMLRNILRARYRYPLHFTTITEVGGDAGVSVGASLGATFPGTSESRNFSAAGALTGSGANDGATSISPGINGSVSTRPSFRAAVLATEKFQRGIQQPVRGELVAYYLDAGWGDELLMSLFVERLDVVDNKTRNRLASIYNDPDDAYDFQSVVCNFVLKSQRIEDHYTLAKTSDVFRPEELRELTQEERPIAVQEFVDLLKDDRITFDAETLSYKTDSSYSVTFAKGRDRCAGADFSRSKAEWRRDHPNAGLAEGEMRNGIPVLPGGALLDASRFDLIGPSDDVDGSYRARFFGRTKNLHSSSEAPAWQDVSLEVHFRSVQDVIYFLGEYVRAGEAAYQLPRENFFMACGATSSQPLRQMRWILRLAEGRADGAINTRFEGKRFAVLGEEDEGGGGCGTPGAETSRSLQVISLVQQLVNLNKSADQLPTSFSIRAIP